jgi:hypothetical protein
MRANTVKSINGSFFKTSFFVYGKLLFFLCVFYALEYR